MANNRMYIRCMVCGKICCIGKSMGAGYYFPYPMMDKKINQFYDDHAFCHDGELFEKLSCDGLFEIVYDHKENEYMKEVE